MIRPSRLAFATLLCLAALPAASAADGPTLLGSSGNWSALTSGSGSSKICYAVSKPTSTDPRKVHRDPVYFVITDWPGRSPKAKSEPEVVPGYQYKDGSAVTAQVGGDKFLFFTENHSGAGAAWVREHADEIKLVEAMKHGQKLVVTGISTRGTRTTDTYSLAGLDDALQKAHAACGM